MKLVMIVAAGLVGVSCTGAEPPAAWERPAQEPVGGYIHQVF
jgi:hypothetical protein